MEILSTIWQVVWPLLLLAAVVCSFVLLIAMFHPLRFDVKMRGSLKGQRAEVWFVYLFRMFRIGIIATPHTQDVIISFLGWKKRLERMSRQKPPSPPPEPPPDQAPDVTTAAQTQHEPIAQTPPGSKAPDTQAMPEPEPESAVRDSSVKEESHQAKTAQPTPPEDTSSEAAAETIEPVEVEPPQPAAIDSSPLKPLHKVEEEYQSTRGASTDSKPAETAAKKEAASLRKILQKFKRDASRRFSQIKGYLRLFRRKWRALAPVFKRFWRRGKKGFGLPRIDLMLRYALHEPYLTGMSHATLAVASGMAGQWGINFMPIPHFGAPMIYSRACITGVIRPWRLLVATGALLFEKELYRELWQLFKWYRTKKQH